MVCWNERCVSSACHALSPVHVDGTGFTWHQARGQAWPAQFYGLAFDVWEINPERNSLPFDTVEEGIEWSRVKWARPEIARVEVRDAHTDRLVFLRRRPEVRVCIECGSALGDAMGVHVYRADHVSGGPVLVPGLFRCVNHAAGLRPGETRLTDAMINAR